MYLLGFALVHQTGLVVTGEAEGVEPSVAREGAVQQLGTGGEGEGLRHLRLALGVEAGTCGGTLGAGGEGGGGGGGGGEDGELHG